MGREVREPGLWSHYVAYMKAALALVRKHHGSRPVPIVLKEKVRREDRTTTRFEHEPEADIFRFLVPLFDALGGLREFDDLRGYILSSAVGDSVFVDAGNNPIRQAETQCWWLMNFYVMPLLTRYIGPELVLRFEEDRAKALYADLEASLECTEAVYSVVAPLQHFEGPDEEVELDVTMVLRRLSEDEIQHFWHLGEFGGMIERSQALSMSSCLATRVVTERNAPTNSSEVGGRVMRVVTALRLLKSGQVGVPTVIQRLREPAFGLAGGTVATSGPSPAALGPGYALLLEDTEALIATYEALADAPSAKDLPVALRRFNYAYERTRPDDRLIDYWVALEALFLPDEPPQELRYRASLRVAYFLGGGAGEREEIFRKIRNSYDVRSAIVHGREAKDVGEIAEFTEDVLRRALRKAIVTPESLDAKQLDQLIVRGS